MGLLVVMNHGPSQEQEVGLHIGHTFQIVSHSSFAICAIQTPVGVRTYAVLCCIGDQVRFGRKVCPNLRTFWPWNVASCVGAPPGSPSSGGDPCIDKIIVCNDIGRLYWRSLGRQ